MHKTHPIYWYIVILSAFLLAACELDSHAAPAPTAPTVDVSATAQARASWTAVPVIAAVTNTAVAPTKGPLQNPTLVPSATPTPTATETNTPTATYTASPSYTPSLTLIPTNTKRPTLTFTPTRAVTRISTIPPTPAAGTWTPNAPVRELKEHFVFIRPIINGKNFWARNYSFGGTDGGNRPVHHGLDMENEIGTPVVAAAAGSVYYAGPDKVKLFGPQPDFYGNVIVIEHPYQDANGKKIYTLYGHLSAIDVITGQSVKPGDKIGEVGSAGVAIGAHLHFEVRSGEPQNYNAVLNPELWLIPFLDYGVLTGRVTDLDGNLLPGYTVEAQSPSKYAAGVSYGDQSVRGDPAFGENFAVPDLPEGYYTVLVKQQNALRFRTLIYVRAGRMNWVDIAINPSGS